MTQQSAYVNNYEIHLVKYIHPKTWKNPCLMVAILDFQPRYKFFQRPTPHMLIHTLLWYEPIWFAAYSKEVQTRPIFAIYSRLILRIP